MIHKVGLFPISSHQQVPFAYKIYTTAGDLGWRQSNTFKKTFSNKVDIKFVGVWLVFNIYIMFNVYLPVMISFLLFTFSDFYVVFFGDTVNSVKLIPPRIPFRTSNTVVCTFRHAISLDKCRSKFKANLWNRRQKDEVFPIRR